MASAFRCCHFVRGGTFCCVGVAVIVASSFASVSADEATAAATFSRIQAFLRKYCIECHGGSSAKAGLSLSAVHTTEDLLRQRKTWENLLDLVEGEAMPPDDRPRPVAADIVAFVQAVRAHFDEFDRTARPDPGRVTMRRLNRAEYTNTIRDLFYGFEANPAEDFPDDDVGHGFDNIGDVLSMSPVLMERYLAAAADLARHVMPIAPPKSFGRRERAQHTRPPTRIEVRKDRFRAVSTASGRKADEAGPIYLHSMLTAPDEYVFSVDCYAERADDLPVRIALFIAGKELAESTDDAEIEPMFGVGIDKLQPLRILGVFDVTSRDAQALQKISVRFSNATPAELFGAALLKTPPDEPAATVYFETFALEGPLDPRPPAMRHLIQCSPTKSHDEQTREILQRFASRAYRRPVTPPELARLVKLVSDAEARGEEWEAGLQLAVRSVLSSPKFLFRAELDDRPTATDPVPLDEYQFASRLSYFLWSSMPDDELFAHAAQGTLSANLDAQVRRMLADPKSRTLVEQFGMQWLQLGRLKAHTPDSTLFPDFNESVRYAMFQETRLFLEDVFRNDRNIIDLIDSDFTFVNQTLAQFYGIAYSQDDTPPHGTAPQHNPGSDGQWQRITLADGRRGGLLTQGSILTATSNPTRTSPVKRGKWVLEQLFGERPPPPPPNVPELEQQSDRLTGTLRQRMEQHRKNPACANCHARMDQIGFALENFDAVGVFRSMDGTEPIDSSGTLPGNKVFRGPAELRKLLAENKDAFARCLTEKLLTFALGRGLEYYDARAVEQIVAALRINGYRFSTLCYEIARSDPFRQRRGSGQVSSEP